MCFVRHWVADILLSMLVQLRLKIIVFESRNDDSAYERQLLCFAWLFWLFWWSKCWRLTHTNSRILMLFQRKVEAHEEFRHLCHALFFHVENVLWVTDWLCKTVSFDYLREQFSFHIHRIQSFGRRFPVQFPPSNGVYSDSMVDWKRLLSLKQYWLMQTISYFEFSRTFNVWVITPGFRHASIITKPCSRRLTAMLRVDRPCRRPPM
jgi:hypothetical protein